MSEHENVVTSREEAKALGLKVYNSGRKCTIGHSGLRYVISDTCFECKKTYRERHAEFGPRCSVEGCDKRRDTKGFCPAHYSRWKKHGDPLGGGINNGDGLKWIADHVHYSGDDCLIWPFGKSGQQKYRGAVYVDGKAFPAHVFMCTLAHGEKPADKDLVAHSCGKGHDSCINPRHLRWATHEENAADKHIHGTAVFGINSPNAKLTEDDVRRIRTLQDIVPQKQLAKMFNVNKTTIARIHDGTAWPHTN